jgi:hypothetical protein
MLAVAVVTAAPASAAPAGSAELVGAWSWEDLDEAIADDNNSSVATIFTRGSRLRIRFDAAGPGSALVWNPRTRVVRFTARRQAAGSAVSVRYRGKLQRRQGVSHLTGRLTIVADKYPGSSAFVAVRSAPPT